MMTRPKSIIVAGACVSLLLACAAATADDPTVPTQIVDLANKVDGVHPGFRAFHAKGVVVEGTFKASAEAAHISSATLFNGGSIPVTARFSDGSGMPGIPDGSPAMPRGIAIKYHLPDGADTDMVTNSFKFFPVGTGEEFRDLLQAVVASPPMLQNPQNWSSSSPVIRMRRGRSVRSPFRTASPTRSTTALMLSFSSARAVKDRQFAT
jgi:catalase